MRKFLLFVCMIYSMFRFRRQSKSRFAFLHPERDPGDEIKTHSIDREILPFPLIPLGSSRDGCSLEVREFSLLRTFDSVAEDHPWKMSLMALHKAESSGGWVLEPQFLRTPTPLVSQRPAISLPPWRLDLLLISHDYVPEKDESCCGSQAKVIWFSLHHDNWQELLAQNIRERLDWKNIAKPLWRRER